MSRFTGECEDGIDEKGWEREMAKPITLDARKDSKVAPGLLAASRKTAQVMFTPDYRDLSAQDACVRFLNRPGDDDESKRIRVHFKREWRRLQEEQRRLDQRDMPGGAA